MKNIIIYIGASLLYLCITCDSITTREECSRITKIEVFSIGFPNVNFPITQSEKDIRSNLTRVITDDKKLDEIEKLVFALQSCEDESYELGSIMGVCDIHCEGKGKYTLIYDKFMVVIGSNIYCAEDNLINKLFEVNR